MVKPELLASILSHLSIKDLTRTLTVSKQWHQVIYGSIELRRELWLEPTKSTKTFLSWDAEYACDGSRHVHQAVLTRNPIEEADLVVEAHPALPRDSHLDTCACADISLFSLDQFKAVPPATLLFQPPLELVMIDYGCYSDVLRCTGGVTFGAVFDAFEKLQVKAREGNISQDEIERDYDGNFDYSVRANEAVLMSVVLDLLEDLRRSRPCDC